MHFLCHENKQTIIDFKNSTKPKKDEWIDVDDMDEQHCRNALKKIIRKFGTYDERKGH